MSSPLPLQSKNIPGRTSENLGFYRARAKYVPDYENGGLRLASVCEFSRPVFNPDRLVPVADPLDYVSDLLNDDADDENNTHTVASPDSIRRATRRARMNVFDLAICNKFDLFSTFTFSPDEVDRTSYDETYSAFKIWLANRVQRKSLKYVAVPEYHKDNTSIHFHMLSNSEPVELADSGHYAHGEKVYNITSWKKGFSTAQFIKGDNSIDFTSKYISKYMTKSNGRKVGGRYYLSGGDLIRPTYVYGESVDELLSTPIQPKFRNEISKDWGRFLELSFI